MAKRANGEGSIRKRTDGKWLVTFPTGLYKENGKREYVYRYADTQAEAAEILRQLQAEKGMGVSHSRAAIKTGEHTLGGDYYARAGFNTFGKPHS